MLACLLASSGVRSSVVHLTSMGCIPKDREEEEEEEDDDDDGGK